MRTSSRFSIAIHTLLCILLFKDEKITSNFISKSANVNPVVIRNILIRLQKAGIIAVKRGTGGISLNRKPENINLLDIFEAVESVNEKLFGFHKNPNPKCPVGRNIEETLLPKLDEVQIIMEKELKKIDLKDVFKDLKKRI